MSMLTPFVTRIGAAEICGCTEGTIRLAIKAGHLRVHETGCGLCTLLYVPEVEEWNRNRPRDGRGRQPKKKSKR